MPGGRITNVPSGPFTVDALGFGDGFPAGDFDADGLADGGAAAVGDAPADSDTVGAPVAGRAAEWSGFLSDPHADMASSDVTSNTAAVLRRDTLSTPCVDGCVDGTFGQPNRIRAGFTSPVALCTCVNARGDGAAGVRWRRGKVLG